jgi:hypothetical protein
MLGAAKRANRRIAGCGPGCHALAEANADAYTNPASAKPQQHLWRQQA